MQYLFSPPREASDSEHEEEVNREGDGESAAQTDVLMAKGVVSRKRRKEANKQFKGFIFTFSVDILSSLLFIGGW